MQSYIYIDLPTFGPRKTRKHSGLISFSYSPGELEWENFFFFLSSRVCSQSLFSTSSSSIKPWISDGRVTTQNKDCICLLPLKSSAVIRTTPEPFLRSLLPLSICPPCWQDWAHNSRDGTAPTPRRWEGRVSSSEATQREVPHGCGAPPPTLD